MGESLRRVLRDLEVDGDERERRFSYTAIQRILRTGI
jgi:hypothetical protein